MKLFAIADLCERWGYTRAGVHKLTKTNDFPKPIAMVALGRTAIFVEEDIINYESSKAGLLKATTIPSKKRKTEPPKNTDWVGGFDF